MPAVQYPFIDIAVHPRIRERFARGEAMALFSVGLDRVLWANGAGAELFGYSAIYDFIEQGAKQGDVSFRQISATARQLSAEGDTRSFLIRIAAGFQRVVANATVEMVRIQGREQAILFSCPTSARELDTAERARQMLEGFDDPDTHMAVIGHDGEIITSSTGFQSLGITPQTASMLVTLTGAQPEKLVKRPIPTGQGYLPAAIGRLSESPALHLLFVVEMVIGHLDPVDHERPTELQAPLPVVPETLEASPQERATDVAEAPATELTNTNNAIASDEVVEEVSTPAVEFVDSIHSATDADNQFGQDNAAGIPAAILASAIPTEAGTVESTPDIGAADHEPAALADQPLADIPDASAADDGFSDWATSDIPSVTAAELSGFEAAVEETPAVSHEPVAEASTAPAAETEPHSTEGSIAPAAHEHLEEDAKGAAFTAMIDAVSEIEDLDDTPEGIEEEEAQATEADSKEIAAAEEPFVVVPVDLPGSPEQQHPVLNEEPVVTEDTTASHPSDEIGDHPITEPEHHSFAETPPEHAESATTVEEVASAELGETPATEQQVPADGHHEPHSAKPLVVYDIATLLGEPAPAEPEVIATHNVETPAEPEEPAEAAAPIETDTEKAEPAAFVFNRNGRATRFVWKIDAEGRFSEISREFAEAVGPHATAVSGVAFADIAALFNLDPDGKIAELLAKRDTWSGRTIHWPVEGTTLSVPVDLAALPTYTRGREFDGFRGFGVVRLSDAAEDPLKLGLTLTDGPAAADGEDAATSEVEENSTSLPEIQGELAAAEAEHEEPAASADEESVATDATLHIDEPSTTQTEEPELPFHSEPPALRIVETPTRRLSDKIIQLHEHRMAASDTLSASEQAAFREIGKQLQPFGKRTEPPAEASELPAANETHAAEPKTPHLEETSEVQAANDDRTPIENTSAVDAAAGSESEFDPLAVLNTAIPPRSKMTDGLSASMVDQLPVAVLVHVGDTLIHANPEFLRLTGYDNFAAIEGVGGLDALLQRHDLQEKVDHPGTMVLVRADDALVPVTARLQSIRWEDTSALMLALMPLEREGDVSEALPVAEQREEARPERMLEKVAKLQVEVEELQSILETATDGVVIIGPEGDMRSMNRSASALFNYDEQETRGKPFIMLFAHESQRAVLDYLSGLTGNGVASVLNDGREVIGREASGGFVPLFMTMGVLTSSNGYCAVIRDITQWKRTEEELRNAKRAAETANAHKSDFLARVSHEIRTPLNAIVGFSDMMASERLGPIGHPRYVEYAGDIGRSGRHVLDIVNDLLDISKIEAGEMDLEFGSVGLNAAISEAVSIVQPQANGQRVIIRTALSQAVPNVVADLRSIKQIALNILSNAIRFTPSGGQIVVSTSYEGNGSVVMRIRDTGVGMTRTELEQAMKPFRQVTTNSRQRGDGTGLGLPLTKAMVDANRALFSIHSAPNEGTLVEVTFPSPRVLAN